MTVYVALDAVRSGKLTLDTPLVMSVRAARMPPSKMGFRPGTEVTLDNALKMLMVKSPNDVAVMVAEGVSGSVEAFANDMNADAQRLGLQESHFVNPNGLHNPDHVSSARDMAMIARALLREFPDHADLFSIGAIQLGRQYIPNHNGLLGRYPGADGMKTGFTCPAGFNVVASANHSGRRLIVVVLGAPSGEIAQPRGGGPLRSRLRHGRAAAARWNRCPSGSGAAPNMRADVCLHRNAAAIAAAEDEGFRPAQAAAQRARRDASHSFGGAVCAPSSRTPSSPTKGSASIRCPSTSVRRPAGRGRRWAPARRRTTRQRQSGVNRRLTQNAPAEGDASAPVRDAANPSGSSRGMPRKGLRRTNLRRARPKNRRRRCIHQLNRDCVTKRKVVRQSFQLFVIITWSPGP